MHSVATVARWLDRIFDHEQRLSLDPNDPGNWTGGKRGLGELKGTMWGIAAHTYPHLDIRAITQDQAASIYIEDYLAPLKADRYEDGVAFALLDFAVNSGVMQAKRSLQRAVGAAVDGVIGPRTLAALSRYTEAQLVMLISAERLRFMTALANWPTHGRGWARRMATNLRHAVEDVA